MACMPHAHGTERRASPAGCWRTRASVGTCCRASPKRARPSRTRWAARRMWRAAWRPTGPSLWCRRGRRCDRMNGVLQGSRSFAAWRLTAPSLLCRRERRCDGRGGFWRGAWRPMGPSRGADAVADMIAWRVLGVGCMEAVLPSWVQCRFCLCITTGPGRSPDAKLSTAYSGPIEHMI